MAVLKPVAEEILVNADMFLAGTAASVEHASPLLLHWAYQAATVYGRLIAGTGGAELGPLENMKVKLRVMSRRWMAAEAYLQILEAREMTSMNTSLSAAAVILSPMMAKTTTVCETLV
ncbi:hypothetical protein MMC18_008186 [Xylographa bjoerkii]|nr:hypothetical protein [Xylographa bjoerkii]